MLKRTGISSAGVILSGGSPYAARVLGYGPIAYWPLWEAAGATAVCQVNSAQNGTYVGPPTLGQPGIGDGNTAPAFDGTNDYVNVYSAALAAALNGSRGSMHWWMQMDVADWANATRYDIFTIGRNDRDSYWHSRKNAANVLYLENKLGGVTKSDISDPYNPAAFVAYGMTWDTVADELKFYIAGAQEGATTTGLGVYAGPLGNTGCVLASLDTGPNNPAKCKLAHFAIFDKVLTGPQVTRLATV